MQNLPENWNQMTHKEKDLFFARYYLEYIRPGETIGLRQDSPQEVKDAYEAFLKETND